MTEKRILIFFDSNNPTDINNFKFLLENLTLSKYEIDLMIEENIKTKVSKKIHIIRFKQPKNKIQSFVLKLKLKSNNKYDSAILCSINSLIGNYCVRKASKNRILITDLKDKEFTTIDEYRKYFIERNIYDFEHIIFENYQEQEKFIKLYPSLSKKTTVINDLINYEEIEKLSKEVIPEKIKRTDTNLLLIEELNEEKNNILEKLELIKDLKTDIPNIKLYIIGDGIDKLAYETYIEDNHLEDAIYLIGNKINVYPYIKKCKYILLNNKQKLNEYLIPSIILKIIVLTPIDFKDDAITFNEHYGFKISNKLNKQKEELLNILKTKKLKKTNLNFEKINKEKMEKIEDLL